MAWAEQLPQNKELQSSEAAQHAGKDSGIRIGFRYTPLGHKMKRHPQLSELPRSLSALLRHICPFHLGWGIYPHEALQNSLLLASEHLQGL